MIIAEFTVDHPILRNALKNAPDVEVTWEQTFEPDDGPMQMIAWVETTDFDAFEDSLDQTAVANSEVVAELGNRRLYRFDFTEFGRRTNLYPVIVERGGVPHEVVGTADGWWFRVQLPGREDLDSIYRFCLDHDIEFTFHRIFDRSEWEADEGAKLTEAQRETLLAAVESGYLSIPRESSLADLGERLGISESAASERFRRGVKSLVEQTIEP